MSRQLAYHHRNKISTRNIDCIRSNLVFRSKTALKNYLLKITNEVCNKIIDSTSEYYNFFYDMLDRHSTIQPEKGMKFTVYYRNSDIPRSYIFLPSTGKWQSFSIMRECVNATNPNNPQLLKIKEYRKAIESQIQLARIHSSWKCENCNSTKSLDVDHFPLKFGDIIQQYENSTENPTPVGFAVYHEDVAKYRLLCKKCHLPHS